MNDSEEFARGAAARADGHSIHNNPYRHKGTAQQFLDWDAGWEAENTLREAEAVE